MSGVVLLSPEDLERLVEQAVQRALAHQPPPSTLLTVGEFAARAGVSVAMIRKMVAAGEGPPTVRLGRSVRIDPEAASAWLAEHVAE
jgi:excisionase family DNA binding protein